MKKEVYRKTELAIEKYLKDLETLPFQKVENMQYNAFLRSYTGIVNPIVVHFIERN